MTGALFLLSFIAGLVVAVRIMLFGIERGGTSRPRFALTAAAAALIAFGIAGYALQHTGTEETSSLWIAVVLAVASGALAAYGARKWSAMPVEHDVDDPRYVLQGHVARVTSAIGPDHDGEITYEFEAARRVQRARTRDGQSVPVGEEVVIEAIEDDVAYVERWAVVEQRL